MLKKCVVIMVMFALVAGAAFAQITFGGQLQEGMDLFSGNNVKEDDVTMGGHYHAEGPYHEAKFSVLFGDGKAGGRLVWMLDEQVMWGWMQWRPNQYFRVKIGSDYDGEGGFPQIAGWGFTGEAKNSVAAVNDYDGSLPMKYRHAGLSYGAYGGDANFNLQLTVFPTDLMAVNFLFLDFDKGGEVSEKLAKMEIYTSLKIEEVGTIRFAAQGKGGLMKDAADGANIGNLILNFYSNEIVQGLAFEAGVDYNLGRVKDDTQDGIKFGAAINLSATDPFNMKIRGGAQIGGKTKGVDNDVTGFSVGILPSYKLPKMTVFFHAGLGMEITKDSDDDPAYSWFINPYVWVPMGGMRMWIGLQILDQHVAQDGQFGWNIPFGFNFYF